MKLTPEVLKLLCDGFGAIAKGAKKIKKGFTLLANQTVEQDDSSESESSDQEETICVPDLLNQDFVSTAFEYMLSKEMRWGKQDSELYFKNMVAGRLRCNHMKFVWVHKGRSFQDKKNWKKISVDRAEEIFSKIREGWLCIIGHIVDCGRPKKVRKSKWSRRALVTNANFPTKLFQKKGFQQILINRHADLPPLR
jgi:hypothetical protein